MILENLRKDNAKGSSLNFSAHGWWGKEKKLAAAKNPVRPRKNTAEGGCGGNSAVFLQKIEASPPPLLVKAMHQRKTLFSLREAKIGRAQNEKSKENFSVVRRMSASGGGAASFVGGFPKMRSDFVQGVEPNRMIRVLRLGASPLGGQIGKNFPRLFGFKANRLRAQNVVRRSKRGVNGNLQLILSLPPKAESKAIIFNCPKAI